MSIDREVVAYHEAGHAVVAHLLGLTVDHITIVPDGDISGHVMHDYGCDMTAVIDGSLDDDHLSSFEAAAKRQWVLERAAIVALSGEVAQRRFRPDSVTQEHGEGDRFEVYQAMRLLVDNYDTHPPLGDAWERVLMLRAGHIVDQYWPRVSWLATVLLERLTLDDSEEIKHTILDGDIPLAYRGKKLAPLDRLALSVGQPIRNRDGDRQGNEAH